jgi:hypothetical protein
LIETTHELLQNDEVYNTIPAEHLLRFMGVLDDSWRFARKFNADRDLRMKLWKVGMSFARLVRVDTVQSNSSESRDRMKWERKLTNRIHEATT